MTTNPSNLPGGGSAHLPWLLRRVNQRYRSIIRERLTESGFGELPQPGYWALMALAGGSTEASQLMGQMGVSKQAVSKLVDVLVTLGYVERTPNAADRRRSDLRLTGKGAGAVEVIESAVGATEATFVETLGAPEFARLLQALGRLATPTGV